MKTRHFYLFKKNSESREPWLSDGIRIKTTELRKREGRGNRAIEVSSWKWDRKLILLHQSAISLNCWQTPPHFFFFFLTEQDILPQWFIGINKHEYLGLFVIKYCSVMWVSSCFPEGTSTTLRKWMFWSVMKRRKS